MAATTNSIAVLKAVYDYTAESEDEVSIKEDQILLLVERTDDDWWKVKPRDADESNEGGLVPSAYVEQAPHKSVVKALYDYDASAPGELSIKEDEILLAFDAEDGWLLVQTEKDGGKAGFVPENYVEATDGEATEETTAEAGQEEQEEQEEEEVLAAPAIIVPPSPPRPPAPYVDPAERVAAAHARAQPVDHIKTWSVSEVDKKGKKKKGTLGIGNGSLFFASEADKNPVQKWPTIDIESSYIEKTKHVHIEITGENPVHLHYNAGGKDYAEEILEKIDSSRAAARAAAPPAATTPEPPVEQPREEPPAMQPSPKPKKNGVSVHFAQRPPSIISPREPDADSEHENYIDTQEERPKQDDGSEWCTVLYDFTADGDDELSVQEGDRLTVMEKDGNEWWKVRDSLGHEGVVPASYVELDEKTTGSTQPNGFADQQAAAKEIAQREQEERERERQRQEENRQRVEAERKAQLAAEAAEQDRRRRERERGRRLKEEEESRRREEEEEEEERRSAARRAAFPTGPSRSPPRSSEDQRDMSSLRDRARASSDKPRSHPDSARVRTWHDRTGQFKVDAEFLGLSNGKLRLHKTNGVIIEVPKEKMSQDDLQYVERLQSGAGSRRTPTARALSPGGSDDEPLAVRRQSLQPEPRKPVPPKKGKSIDWFEFFLNAGCDIDDCTRYAASFERDKIDEAILPDITEQTMRSLGLREGDIIRVTKAIQQRTQTSGGTTALEEQTRKDEELARKLQEEEGKGMPKRQATSPGLFAGPGGILKNNTRRGRPQPSRSTPPATVDLQSINTASTQINRVDSPLTTRVASPTIAVPGPPRSSSAAPVTGGFDDDAWTNRPTSTQPTASTTRALSTPPAQPQPAGTQAPLPPAPAPPPAPLAQASSATSPTTATTTGSSLAKTTESDIFNQLARLSALRTQSPATQNTSPPQASSAPISAVSPPPARFQSGLGMGPSPAPIGQLQSQVASFQQQQQNTSRGPFAPVPANQGLLQPLIPTTTGFNSFVPTRPASNPPQPTFNPPPQPPSFLNTQPTGFSNALTTQPTGYQGSMNYQPTGFSGGLNVQSPNAFGGGLQSQPTGLPNSGPLMAQTTSYPGAFGSGPFSGGRAFGPLQPNITGFNPSFGQASSPPPPVPPIPPLPTNNSTNNSTAPANVFAQMKSGTFANDNAPQTANKYDALRPQPTGWGLQGTTTGFQNGYSGPFY